MRPRGSREICPVYRFKLGDCVLEVTELRCSDVYATTTNKHVVVVWALRPLSGLQRRGRRPVVSLHPPPPRPRPFPLSSTSCGRPTAGGVADDVTGRWRRRAVSSWGFRGEIIHRRGISRTCYNDDRPNSARLSPACSRTTQSSGVIWS